MQSYRDIDSFADASALSTLGRMRTACGLHSITE